jgi:translocation and assembly module TamB
VSRARRWWLAAGAVLALSLLALGLGIHLLLASRMGADFALSRVRAALPEGALQWDALQGDLAHGLRLEGLRYIDGDLRLDVEYLELRIARAPLARGRVRIEALSARGLTLTLADATEAANPEPFALELPQDLSALQLPVALEVVEAQLEDLVVQRGGLVLFEASRLQMAAALDAARLQIDRLTLESTAAQLTLEGMIETGERWRSALALDGEWREGLAAPQPLSLRIDGDLDALQARLRLPDQAHARLDLSAQPLLPQPVLTLALELPQPTPALAGLWPQGLGSLSLSAEGGLDALQLDGRFDYDGQAFTLVDARLSAGGDRLEIGPARLQAEQGAVELQGSLQRLAVPARVAPAARSEDSGPPAADAVSPRPPGDVDALPASASPWRLELAANFEDFEWRSPDQPALRIDGRAEASGLIESLALVLDLQLERDELAGAVRGELQLEASAARLDRLRLDSGEGRAELTGRVDWTEGLSWELLGELQEFDPRLFAPGWQGKLSARFSSAGRHDDRQPSGRLELDELDGELRGRPLRGAIDADWQSYEAGRVSLALDWGDSVLRGQARLGEVLQGELELAPLHLDLLLPGAAGALEGRLQLAGSRSAPELSLQLEAPLIEYADLRMDALRASGRLGLDPEAPAELELRADAFAYGTQSFGALALQLRGETSAHVLNLALADDGAGPQLELSGGWQAERSRWIGQLQTLAYTPAQRRAVSGDWALSAPTALELGSERLRVESFCIEGSRAPWRRASEAADSTEREAVGRLCAELDWSAGTAARAWLELDAVPVALPLQALRRSLGPGLPWRPEGVLTGQLELQQDAAGWRAEGRLSAPRGWVALSDPQQRRLLEWEALNLELAGDPRQLQAQLSGQIGQRGSLNGQILLDAPGQPDAALQGRIDLDLPELQFIELFSAQAVVAPSGRLVAGLDIGGRLDAPELVGAVELSGFSAELPGLGISPREGRARIELESLQRARIDFALRSEGELRGSGVLDWSAQAESRIDLTLEGEEVLFADTAQAELRASPQLTISEREGVMRLRGRVDVPRAQISLDRFENSLQPSADVVVLDPAQRSGIESAAAQRIDADLRLALGRDVRLKGFGLDGKVIGELRLRDRPGRNTQVSGALNVTGRYKAYGQDLDITRGRLAYAQTPPDNPALDIVAERKLERVTVGIRVVGTAVQPQLSLWSDPSMDQADVLSYLVIGRPLSAARSGEGQQINAAATAIGAGGNLLAERLGARLGFDQAGIEESAALGGAALTVGKFLSPRLYVAYGVALFGEGQVFSIKYLLNAQWDVQVDTTQRETRGSLNYRLER